MSRCLNLLYPALTALGVAVAVFGAPASASAAFKIDFGATPTSKIVFNPANGAGDITGSFSFTTLLPSGNVFQITSGGSGSPFGGPDSLNLLNGTITGSYDIHAISPTPGGGESATVTNSASGTHQFKIQDANGLYLTANVDWKTIETKGTGGILNTGGVFNLSGFSYSGTNQDLIDLAANIQGSVTVSFQFINPTRNLTSLTSSPGSTSFSGSLSAPQGGPLPTPAPAGLVLLASGLPFLLVGRAFRRSPRTENALAV